MNFYFVIKIMNLLLQVITYLHEETIHRNT